MDNDNKEIGFRDSLSVSEMYEKWYLDYASYVILERAIPRYEDGLKPVQRRILHALKNIDDGRFHKVANVIGQTMQFHPHGDAAINDALVALGQKDLLVDTQGNWGDYRTGDRAAASRYIETRLTDFAKKVSFNKNITNWIDSYDGRNKEPEVLPVKFPILLYQGAEGIAVGLSTKILPHNFNEIIRSIILYLKGKPFTLLPDFNTGGSIDTDSYNRGARGGKVRVRADIDVFDKNTLAISSVPYGVTTTSLIDSIIGPFIFNNAKLNEVTSKHKKVTLIQSASWGIQDRTLSWFAERNDWRTVFIPYTTDQLTLNGYLLTDYDVVCAQGQCDKYFAEKYHSFPVSKIERLGSPWSRYLKLIRDSTENKNGGKKKRKIIYAGISSIKENYSN